MVPAPGPFGRQGDQVTIHPTVQCFNPEKIFIGSRVRIDCFCMLSAGPDGLHIGDNVHIAAGVYIFGNGGKIAISDFCGISSRVSLYSATDDYSSGALTNPTIPEKYRSVKRGSITLEKHALVGSGSIIMPGVRLGVGASVGALSYVNKSVKDFLVVGGNPLRIIGKRDQRLLELEREYLRETQQG